MTTTEEVPMPMPEPDRGTILVGREEVSLGHSDEAMRAYADARCATLQAERDALAEKVRAIDMSIIIEAAEVLERVGSSGVTLPENWRWPLADELNGIAAIAVGDKP